jgi:hypothetical protein
MSKTPKAPAKPTRRQLIRELDKPGNPDRFVAELDDIQMHKTPARIVRGSLPPSPAQRRKP